ncbi:MAG: alanine racemase [Stappia sp.]|nr:alanine racemase [Stappia sp.]
MSKGTAATPAPGDNGTITIDLAALARNWRALAARTAPNGECGAAVKADGYGLGLDKVLPTLLDAGCRTFFVATPHEGEAARALAPDAVIYVLNGLYPGSAGFLAANRLRPVLGSLDELREWQAFGEATGTQPPAALHVDTGISRLGLSADEARTLAGDTKAPFAPELVISHLACADTPAHALNARQHARFTELAGLFPGARRSLANSAGVFLDPAFHFELSRPGIALYGARAAETPHSRLETVVTLQARVLQTHVLRAGETIGYGASYTAKQDTLVAMIAAGYADGYLRATSGSDSKAGAEVHAGGKRLPVIGRVSMDMLGIDASALGADGIARGDMVELFGPNMPVDDVAERAGTIPYELLTSLGARFRRIYRPASGEAGG